MNTEVVIEVKNVSKKYKLGQISHGTLTRDLQSWWAKLRGKEDPNSKVLSATSPQVSVDSHESFMALDGLSFTVKKGEVLGVIGRNGAGKSTLLKILSRITVPTEGEIIIHGRAASLLEVGTGFHGELTGRENIYLNGAILGMSKQEINKKIDAIISFSELEMFIDTPVKRYSSGMTVRLAFSVAAHLDPDILIVDEVLAVGDLNFRKKCLGKMRELSSSAGRTVLFVSHDMASVQNLCSTGMLLDHGKIVFMGDASDTVKEYLKVNQKNEAANLEWLAPQSGLPFPETIRIERFYVRDENGNIAKGGLFNSKNYSVVIECELIQTDPRLIFQVAFYSDNQELLFVTDVHDLGKHNFAELKPGKIELSVDMPSNLLCSSNYEIELLCALHHTGWVLPPNNNSRISFEYFKDKNDNPYDSESRLGALAPMLDWKLKLIK